MGAYREKLLFFLLLSRGGVCVCVCVRLLNCRRQTVLRSSRHLVQTLSAPVRKTKCKYERLLSRFPLRESRLTLCPSFAVQVGLLLCQQQAAAVVAPYGPCMLQIRYLFTQLINGILNRFIFELLTFCWPALTCLFQVVSFKRMKDQKVELKSEYIQSD